MDFTQFTLTYSETTVIFLTVDLCEGYGRKLAAFIAPLSAISQRSTRTALYCRCIYFTTASWGPLKKKKNPGALGSRYAAAGSSVVYTTDRVCAGVRQLQAGRAAVKWVASSVAGTCKRLVAAGGHLELM